MHALFDKTAATQGWRISARMLREYIEYFGLKTEQLDLLAQEGKAIFTSFTEKIQDGKGTLGSTGRILIKLTHSRSTQTAARDSDINPHGRLRRLPRAGKYARRHQRQRLQSDCNSCRNTSRHHLCALLLPDSASAVQLPERWSALRIYVDDNRGLSRCFFHSKPKLHIHTDFLQAAVRRSNCSAKQKCIGDASTCSSRRK